MIRIPQIYLRWARGERLYWRLTRVTLLSSAVNSFSHYEEVQPVPMLFWLRFRLSWHGAPYLKEPRTVWARR